MTLIIICFYPAFVLDIVSYSNGVTIDYLLNGVTEIYYNSYMEITKNFIFALFGTAALVFNIFVIDKYLNDKLLLFLIKRK